MIRNKERRERFKKNLNIYQITLKEIKEKKKFHELSYPESIGYGKNNRINYKQSIGELEVAIRSLKKHLGMVKVKDSGIIEKRKEKLEKHLKKLRSLRNKRCNCSQSLKKTSRNEVNEVGGSS